MPLNLVTKTINTSYTMYMGSDQQKVETKLFSEKGQPIAKILCTKMVACSDETEVLNSEARYVSKVRFEVVYLSEDGSFHTITDTVSFNGKIQNSLFNTNVYPLTTSEVIDSQIHEVQSDMVHLISIVDTKIDGVVNDKVEFVEDVPNNMVAKKDKFSYCNMVAAQKAKFKVNEEYEMKEDISHLLMATVHLCNQEVVAGTNYITIKGDLNLVLTYETAGNEKQIKSSMQTFKFTEEVEAPNVNPGNIINFISSIRPDEINVFGNNIDGKTVFKVSIGLCYNYVALKQEEMDAVTDAFSIDNDTNLTAESFYKCKYNCITLEEKNIITSIILEDNQKEIDTLQANCGGYVVVANVYGVNGKVIIEGIVHVNVVYYALEEGEEVSYESSTLETPYSIELMCKEATEASNIISKVDIKDIAIKRRRSRELELEVKLCALAQVTETEQEMVLHNIEESSGREETECALKMFVIRKGSNLWDVCKKTNATPDMIKEQNPNVTFPILEDTTIVIYKPKEEQY